MNFKNFTIKSQEALQEAINLVEQNGQQSVEPSHLMSGIISVGENVTNFIFNKLGVNAQAFADIVKRDALSRPKVSGGEPYLSRESNDVLQRSISLSKELGDEYVSLEAILLALFLTESSVSKMMKSMGMTEKGLKQAIFELRNGQSVHSQSSEDNYQSLSKYAINLIDAARSGKLDPVIGRDDEIRRVLQILSRRTKNNPILIGEPGTGKTAIVEGLAHRILRGDVPENLKDKQLYSLDMGARLKSVVNEVTKSEGNIILFIDEIHTLVGAGKSEGAMDAANILKPALARGELRSIGATTLDEYQKYFEKDKALERRFQTVMVDEPSVTDSISILRGLKERYENHHKVRIMDEAIISAVELSNRYITDRYLPDKAIDLMDEAAAKLRMERDSVPEELDNISRQLKQLEIEREAIKRDVDTGSGGDASKESNATQRLKDVEAKIANLREEEKNYKSKWESERALLNKIQHNKQEIERLKFEADRAEREGDYGRVAEIRYGKLQALEAEIKSVHEELSRTQSGDAMVKEEVTSDDIAEIVSRWTGIPVTKMQQSEREKLLHLEEELHKRVVGQDEAILAVSDAVRRSRAGLQDPRRPIGSFIFLGTTGVGKTELAKALANYLFDDDSMMTRIDMSEYQEKHSVSRLIGAPPGYVGYDEGGQLTEAVRRKPYSVILFDEIEKAHPDVFNILLQVLDDGRLTDNKGRTVNFKNTIIIMTSNMGSHLIQEKFEGLHNLEKSGTMNTVQLNHKREELMESTKNEVMSMLKQQIRPEFLNRIDEIIMFSPLNEDQIKDIVRMQVDGIIRMLSESGIQMRLTDDAIAFLGKAGFDPEFGARPVKRAIQRYLLNDLSKKILSGEVNKEHEIVVDATGEGLRFSN